jgi:cyclopropane fatty-acyl-phospholipid synthase-like methyltransferase
MIGPHTEALRHFWGVPTLEQAQHERVTVPPQPEAWEESHQQQQLDRLFGDLELPAGARLLDFGCGVGRLIRPLARRGYRIVAVDVSPQMLSHCAAYCNGLDGIEYLLCDGCGVPDVPTASVDGAYSYYVFQHMPSVELARTVIADLHRVVRPGGWCRVQTVDIGTDAPVSQVGFHGQRQTAAFLLECGRAAGFSHLQLDVGLNEIPEYLVLTARK